MDSVQWTHTRSAAPRRLPKTPLHSPEKGEFMSGAQQRVVQQSAGRYVTMLRCKTPSKADLYATEFELPDLEHREYRLRDALETIVLDFDFILIDCPSSLGWLTLNALTAAEGVILPLQCDYFALEGMQQLLNTIRLVRDRLNPRISLFGVVLTMFDPRTTLGQEVVREIGEHFPKEKFNTIIPRTVRLAEAPSFGQTILEHDARSPGALAYKQLAEEVIARALVGVPA